MSYLDNVLFAIVFGLVIFCKISKIIRNINLGIDVNRKDNAVNDGKNMAMIALAVKKMVKRPVAEIMHHCLCRFCIINIELLEIIIDGLLKAGCFSRTI
jgi:pyruvate/oxaloacetate carboxyltransferase